MDTSELRQSDYVIFLLGAGASHSYELPLMSEFIDVAQAKYFAYKKESNKTNEPILAHYDAMLRFHQQCNESASRIKMNWDNIEELYTQADLRRLAQIPDKDTAEKLCHSIAWVIWDVYRRPRSLGTGVPVEVETFCNMIEAIQKANLKPAIITTNYDVCIERCLQKRRKSAPLPFVYPGFKADSRKPELVFSTDDALNFEESRTKIVKLHGSVSWFFGDTDDQYIGINVFDGCSNWDVTWDHPNHQDFVRKLQLELGNGVAAIRPAIIPPMLGKGSTSALFAKQWKVAIALLARARYIYVVGYSFPTTDAFMKRLLSDGLKDNHNLKNLCIIDIQEEALWKDRMESLFNPLFKDNRVVFGSGKASAFLGSIGRNPGVDNWPGMVKAIR